jgi:hypothetical protein
MTMSRRLLCASIAILAVGCSAPPPKCDLDVDLEANAGTGAIDCGLVPAGGDSSVVDACVRASFSTQTPFVARYALQGIDSYLIQAIAGGSQGGVVFFFWDSAPCGGPDCAARISQAVCEGPSVNTAPRDTPQWLPLTCASMSHGQICG